MHLLGNKSLAELWPAKPRLRFAWAIAFVVVASGIAAVAWSVWGSLGISIPPTRVPGPRAADSQDQDDIPPLSAFAESWGRELRRPLVDPASVAAKKQKPEVPEPRVQRPQVVLLGVYGGRYAVFRTGGASGNEVTVGKGESIGDATVEAISQTSVVLVRSGTPFEFKLSTSGAGRE